MTHTIVLVAAVLLLVFNIVNFALLLAVVISQCTFYLLVGELAALVDELKEIAEAARKHFHEQSKRTT